MPTCSRTSTTLPVILFRLSLRVDSVKPAGTGLGLYLCRRYVELMQGDLRVEGRPGKGACFTIRLPGKVVIAEHETASLPQPA